MKGKTIILGVCGGIAAYKAAALCSKLTQAGAKVHVVMTESATKLVAPATFQALSHEAVRVDTFDELDPKVISHIDLADRADAVVIAPATANMLAKMAHGIADDMLSTILLATTSPILAAPAMNVHMYAHPATQANMEILRERGVQFIEPGVGQLACGYVGKGRLEEPEAIVEYVKAHFASLEAPKLLAGKKVMITAGGTVERLDPVRYFTNDSSGKMGFALAEAARDMGADVTLIAARVSEAFPSDVTVIRAESALEMEAEVLSRYNEMDLVVKAAAVADYRPSETAAQKIKKTGETLNVTLVKNPDILEELGRRKEHQFLIGFAAETEQLESYAMDKLVRKNCDLLVANDVSQDQAGFGKDTNIVTIFDKNGPALALPVLGKRETANRILQVAAERMNAGGKA
ncbi:bifunctional phosphopantothenoylcysteine decarboxylase/phosphopantothenate--cysteine ligase CoaBC [Gorillibacterium timonense]|uniref:bifunctional phosphopantothenoylcysteine decarboxylase/phosphopantothenate--cysteine ligase CoaBC n=1 Tax=Gorillibacterium timonense TaxID=1689269 RepID=UPI00071D426F|nr:bifunctional phosphopantothenoylcysteine decarboxylase/phosphopantothenate--cysteine ligase CoaBC [Gorillibacterium timonense]